MDTLQDYLLIVVGILVVAVVAIVGLVRGRGGKTKEAPKAPAPTRPAPRRDAPAPTWGDVLEPKAPARSGTPPGEGERMPGAGAGATRAGDTATTDEGDRAVPATASDTTPTATAPDTDPAGLDRHDTTLEPGDRDAAPLGADEGLDVGTARPGSARGRMHQLRSRLARSNTAFGRALLSLLSSGKLDEEAWEEVEDTLLASDLGVQATSELVATLRTHVKVDGTTDEAEARELLRSDLLTLVDPTMDRRIASSRRGDRPAVVMVVGVNGTGKTTTVGKLARVLVAEDREVVLGAADTFRAAAADQLQTWGERVGVATVRSHRDGADPASVAFDAVKAGIEQGADVVILDTAGRLHNKVGLMDELGKIRRVVEKTSEVDEVILVLDATTGQNGLKQAEAFAKEVAITGIALTKLDGTAKGGIVVAIQRALGVPVKLVGLGEGPDDLAPFDPVAFVDAIVA
ncbi:signal recognition particle-docking protein FtsY [Arsenicicoccus sp. oral taxon 190]|uniref:signal recognition particle-docking protein FtsY n=1 Tax=Arsenicicoccus sp. oral taxon 190 TaxID=1658671 RepID=UPI00067A313F|nr:signal recognition particle-docking protein FtsY [Arsenicicoccus sp. oral taxon 190]AKT52257.1 cell division protein FtsY [Arsenicicoccus sp. oral taxon 190]